MPTTRTRPPFLLIAAGLIVTLLSARWVFVSSTEPLHPDPTKIPSVAQSAPPPAWTHPVEQARLIARASLSAQSLPGLSVAAGIDGTLVWAEGFGFADLDTRAPVTPDHRFRIGTASIVLTSAAAGLLIEKERLKLDERIQTYVPSFPEKKWPVTLRRIMGHTAGIESDSGDEGPLFSESCAKPADALRHFAGEPLLFEPGTKYRYSRYGWILVSAAIEAAAGEPFLEFMERHVFEPLAMRDTLAESSTKAIPDRATFYFPRFAADPTYGHDLMRDLDYSCYSGSSVFLSTPSDLVRFGMAINSGKLLKPATVDLLQSPQRLSSGAQTGYGLGWDLETVTLAGKPTRVAGHDGDSLGGMVSSLVTSPEHGLAVAVISNISYADTFGVATKIAQVFVERGNK